MYLSSTRYRKLKNIALNIYKRYDIKSFPINPFELCEKIGIQLVKYSEIKDSHERKLLFEASKDAFYIPELRCIVYNDEISIEERLFNSIMHELSHYFCGHKEHSQLAESEANFLATYFRAPIPIICEKHFKTTNQISNYFKISEESASYALNNAKKVSKNQYAGVDFTLYNDIIMQFEMGGEQ